MMKICILFIFLTVSLNAASKYPVDVCYLVADLKYSKEDGVKICEIQHGILSTFFGDVFLNKKDGLISPQIEQAFAEFPIKKWGALQIAFPTLASLFKNSPEWILKNTYNQILEDIDFKNSATIPPEDPKNIASYQGILFIRSESIKSYDLFHQKYPGIILSGAPSNRYWVDKYKMSVLFNGNALLEKIKPEWRLYPKVYSDTLAQKIIDDIPSDFFVIKPRGAFLGRGVIIVSKNDLDATLKYILIKSDTLGLDKDKSYNHWNRDQFDSFIVEKYYPSDLINVEALGSKTYQPTMRAAFILTYNNEAIDFKFLGGYWMLPVKSVDEEGSPNQLTKAYCKVPFFINATDAVLKEVEQQLQATMPLLYQQMLEEK